MKKKGLIISTVVMVVILIASLTTATYAWFSSSAAATVSDISLSVGAATTVQIGVGSGGAATDYTYGDMAWTGSEWKGANQGLGLNINTGLSMDVTAGVGSGTVAGDTKTMDATYNADNTLLKGSGDFTGGERVSELTGVTEAVINGKDNDGKTDVIDLNMGIKVAQADVYGTYCKITVKPDGDFVGMAAALRFEIKVGSKSWAGDLLGTSVKFDQSAPADGFTFFFMIDDAAATAYAYGNQEGASITDFSIRFFVFGYDTDCCTSATGTGATISLEFAGCSTASTKPTNAGTEIVLA